MEADTPMGTRADFYVGRGAAAEWIGSIAMDGYPREPGHPRHIIPATDETDFRERVARLSSLDHFTSPEMGWPWPWETSHTTDYTYAYADGRVWASCFGSPWWDATEPEPEDVDTDAKGEKGIVEFPVFDTSSHARAGTRRSGNIVIYR